MSGGRGRFGPVHHTCDCDAPRDVYLEDDGTWVQCTECSHVWRVESLPSRKRYPTILRTCAKCGGEFLDDSGLSLQSPRWCPECHELWIKKLERPRPAGWMRLLPRMHTEFWYWPHIMAVAFVVWLAFRVF